MRHVVIVGGGVIGLSTAYYLRREGVRVTVLERASVGSGASSGNTGWLAPSFSAPLPGPGMPRAALGAMIRRNGSFRLDWRHLPRLASWLAQFAHACTPARHQSGLRAMASLAATTHRLCDELAADGVAFRMQRRGVLHAFASRGTAETALRALQPLAAFGLELPEHLLDRDQLLDREPALGAAVTAGFVVSGDRTVQPESLVSGLRTQLLDLGATIHEHAPALSFTTREGNVTGVATADGRIDTDALILAAGAWSRDLARQLAIRLPVEAGKGYSFTITPATEISHSLHLFEPRVAASPFDGGARIAGTMELSGLNLAIDRGRIAAIARAAAHYLRFEPGSLRHEWAGLRPMTPDGLPALGRAGRWRNVFLATGHGMHGMLLALPSGHAVARQVLGQADPRELAAFSPDRFARRRQTVTSTEVAT